MEEQTITTTDSNTKTTQYTQLNMQHVIMQTLPKR